MLQNRQHPWLLLNLRNPDVITKLLEDTPYWCNKQLISLLFLVTCALMWRGSNLLAAQYFAIITADGDFPLYTSSLTTIAPAVGPVGLCAIGMLLVEPPAPISKPIPFSHSVLYRAMYEMFTNYDRQLGGRQNPDHSFVAILLMLSKQLPEWARHNPPLNLINPWLRLAAQFDVPDWSYTAMGSLQNHRVHTMIAALSLLRYIDGTVAHYTL